MQCMTYFLERVKVLSSIDGFSLWQKLYQYVLFSDFFWSPRRPSGRCMGVRPALAIKSFAGCDRSAYAACSALNPVHGVLIFFCLHPCRRHKPCTTVLIRAGYFPRAAKPGDVTALCIAKLTRCAGGCHIWPAFCGFHGCIITQIKFIVHPSPGNYPYMDTFSLLYFFSVL